MFAWFERLVNPYPDAPPARPPAGLSRLSLGLLGGPASLPAVHHRTDGDHRCLRGAAVQHDGEHRRLARQGRAERTLDYRTPAPAAAGHGARRQHSPDRAAIRDQAAGTLRQFPDAPALELPPAIARPEHALLPGRVRRAHRHQGHADGARGARHVAHRLRAAGIRRHLFRHHDGGTGRLRPLAARPVSGLGGVLCRRAVVLRAPARPGGQGAGRRALADDRAHHRRVHQHRDGEALRTPGASRATCARRCRSS